MGRRRVCQIGEVDQKYSVGSTCTCPWGPTVSLADMDVAEAEKEMGGVGCDSYSPDVSSASSESGESPTSSRNAPAALATATATAQETVPAKFTLGSQAPSVLGGKRVRRARVTVHAPRVGRAGGPSTSALRVKRRVFGLSHS